MRTKYLKLIVLLTLLIDLIDELEDTPQLVKAINNGMKRIRPKCIKFVNNVFDKGKDNKSATEYINQISKAIDIASVKIIEEFEE